MKLLTITLLTTCTLLCGCCGSDCGTADASLDYAAINAQAAEQYLRPIRPGYEGRNPFWNGFAKKFIYAPAFDFDEVAGAANYRFTVVPLGEETQASWSFTADSPKAALTPVWGEIPVGRVRLTVEGLDASGKALGKAGEREFLRDYPFTGPYTPAVRDYRQAALMGLLYIHRMPEIQYWAEHTEPDMNYRHNTYPCKIIGATIRAEALLARLLPAHKEQATRIARNAAQFLIDQSRPAGDPLAFFPPTYYKDLIASKRAENQNKTMTMEAASAGHAFLDLYDLTGDKAYYDRALGIADTYVRLQREDGSLPIKVDFVTGEPVNDACAMLHPLLRYFQRLKAQHVAGITDDGPACLAGIALSPVRGIDVIAQSAIRKPRLSHNLPRGRLLQRPDPIAEHAVLTPDVGSEELPVHEHPSVLPVHRLRAQRIRRRNLPDRQPFRPGDHPGESQPASQNPQEKFLVDILRALHGVGAGRQVLVR